MNRVFVTGNVTKKPGLRQTSNGKSVATLSIAEHSRNKTNFLNFTVWDKQAENCSKYLEKGQRVTISGHIDQTEYEGKYRLDLIADDVEFGERKKEQMTDVFEEELPWSE